MSRNSALSNKFYNLLAPTTVSGSSYTTTPAYVQIDPNNEADATAIVTVGQVFGSPTSSSVVVTIIGSATGGSDAGTVLATISSPVPGTVASSTVTAPQVADVPIIINTGTYQYIKAKAVCGFNGGTTPSLNLGVILVNRQTVDTTSNQSALS